MKVAIGSGVVLLAGGLWLVTLVPGWLSHEPGSTREVQTPEAASARRIQATLFYVSEDGAELVPSTRDVPYGATASEQARQIVMAQLKAPAQGFVSPIPEGTSVRGVFMGGHGELYVDLSPEVLHHPGGSLDEALTVYAIVNAVTTSLPDVTAVQILIDGKEVDSLAGHIDLREPIGRSDAWVRKGQ
ncbi:MAG TPA: GerMN domain-containing protein [Vicinamibacterales bacterium]|nr:GerMN domain-containing protein [Vicinamibacterales bacterium]